MCSTPGPDLSPTTMSFATRPKLHCEMVQPEYTPSKQGRSASHKNLYFKCDGRCEFRHHLPCYITQMRCNGAPQEPISQSPTTKRTTVDREHRTWPAISVIRYTAERPRARYRLVPITHLEPRMPPNSIPSCLVRKPRLSTGGPPMVCLLTTGLKLAVKRSEIGNATPLPYTLLPQ